jgi:hypothetical protein
MQWRRWRLMLVGIVVALGSATLLHAQNLPLEPVHNTGQGVTGAYEGWFRNQDGSFSFLLGYFNRNLKQDLEIPIGPENRIDPGGPDQGQPTYFLPGRQWGVFTVTVPKDFGTNKLAWTLVSNGQTAVIPLSLDPLWEVSPFIDPSTGNTPPILKLEGASVQGPRPVGVAMSTKPAAPLKLSVSVTDDAKVPLIGGLGLDKPSTPPLTVTWIKLRGPGTVTFGNAKPAVELANNGQVTSAGVSGAATTTATFSEPGDYVLLVVANDWSGVGGHGYQCCWTNAHVRVSVKP